ncbi:glycosyltransferase, partial [bacterium]|nr:glycosyltransferase [bacterium]
EACEKLGRKLIIVGAGQRAKELQRQSGPGTQWLGNLPDDQIADLYAGARAFLFPGTEDFGITPLEAMASGTPVIAYGAGGALETVEDGKTGMFFYDQSAEGLAQAIEKFETLPTNWEKACRERAALFSKERFKMELRGLINRLLARDTATPAVSAQAPMAFYD